MPNQSGINRRVIDARERIKTASLILSGGKYDIELKTHKRNKELSGMFYLEGMADFLDWMLSDQEQPAASQDTPEIPLEHLTMSGLQWLAEQRGVDVSDLSRKAEIIEALEE